MNIKTRAELDEALRRVLVDAIADDPGEHAEAPELVTVARSDVAFAHLPSLRQSRIRRWRRPQAVHR